MVSDFWARWFRLYPGEARGVVLFSLLGFLWSLAVSAGLKFSDAFFLTRIGPDRLPIVYGMTATMMIFLASLMIYAFHRFDTDRIFFFILAVAACAYGSFSLLLRLWGEPPFWFWYLLRVSGTIFLALFTTCFWTFIDQYYSLQDGKRLFPLFSSSIFCGMATTGFLMHEELLTLEQLFLLMPLLFAITALLIFSLCRVVTAVHDEHSLQESGGLGELAWREIFRSLRSSPFTLFLMVGSFLLFLGMVVTEFHYLSAFEERYQTAELLTSFLGRCLLFVSMGNLFVGLFLYSRALRRFGLGVLLLVTPVMLVGIYSGWLLVDSLVWAVAAFFIVEGSNYVVDDSNFNLLLHGVPVRLKYRVRIVIESFFEPVGMLFCSFLLLRGGEGAKLSGLFIALLLFFVMIVLGSLYGRAIYRNLAEHSLRFHRRLTDWWQACGDEERRVWQRQLLDSFSRLQTSPSPLSREEEEAMGVIVEFLFTSGDLSVCSHLLERVLHAPLSVKRRLLLLLTKNCGVAREGIQALVAWSEDEEDPELWGELQFLLAQLGLFHPEKAVSHLRAENLCLRGGAILALKKSWAHLSSLQAAKNRILAVEEGEQLLASGEEEKVVMGLRLLVVDGQPEDVDRMVTFLRDRRPAVACAAMESFASMADGRSFRHVRLLLRLLWNHSSTEYRYHCLRALCRVGGSAVISDLIEIAARLRPSERRYLEQLIAQMGQKTVPLLLSLVQEGKLAWSSRIVAVKLLSRLALPQLKENLMAIFVKEMERAYFYDIHRAQVELRYPHLDLSLLVEALKTSFRSTLEFIIHFLGEAGEIEDCELLVRSLGSRNPKVRSHVVETLEKSCDRALFRLLYPLVADLPEEERRRCAPPLRLLSLEELLEVMGNSPSQLERMVAVTYQHLLSFPHWRSALRQQMIRGEELFHRFAYELLESPVPRVSIRNS